MNTYPKYFTINDKEELDIIRKAVYGKFPISSLVIEEGSRYVNIEVSEITNEMWDILDTINTSLPVGFVLISDNSIGERYDVCI